MLIDGRMLQNCAGPPLDWTEIVRYPFPTPDQSEPLFRVAYLGLDQHFGPPVIGPALTRSRRA